MDEVSGFFGSLGLPAAMTMVMLVVYRVVPSLEANGIKTLIVVGFGILLSIVSVVYDGRVLSLSVVVDCFFYGIQLGATSIGLFKVGQATGVFKDKKGGG